MNDEPRRLLDSDLPPSVRETLASASMDGPTREGVKRAAVALGLSAAAGTLAKAATGAAVGASAPGSGWACAMAPAALMKWLLLGSVVGVVGLGTVSSLRHEPPPEPPGVLAPPATPSTVAVAIPLAEPSTEPERPSEPRTQPTPVAPRAVASVEPHDDEGPPPSLGEGPKELDLRLRRELALLDEARNALRSGQPERALRALDRHAALPLPHSLDSEALLLRVRALSASGDPDAAGALARGHLASHPDDAYAENLRAVAPPGSASASGTAR